MKAQERKGAQAAQGTGAYQTTAKERFFYCVYSFGQMSVYVVLYLYLQVFLTDIGLSAGAVGTIFLVSRVWDAINDPLFGVLVDKVRLKRGKYTPWIQLSSFLIPVFTMALFLIPAGLPLAGKTALALVLYLLWDTSYTICDVPYFSVVTTMTSNLSERNRIIASSRIFTSLGSGVAAIAVPLIYPRIGWQFTVLALSALALLAMVPLGFAAQERGRALNQEAPSLKDLIKTVAGNKNLLVFCGAVVVANLTNYTGAVGGYFAIHNLGGPEMMSVLSLVSMIPGLVVIGLVPALSRKMDKFHLFLWSLGLTVLLSVPIYIVGYSNVIVFMALFTVRSIVSTISGGMLSSMFILDCTEYGKFKTGKDATAASVSVQTFTTKLFVATSSAMGMFILGYAGFVSGDGAVQPQSAVDMLWRMVSILPVIGQVLSFFILLVGYKLRQRDVELMARANAGEISRREALRALSLPKGL
jgi:sugar (glycoside-pentoside-hexuronide) transporter